MALVLADRVKETTTTTGTGTITLAGAVTGFRTFASAIGSSNTTYYTIAGQSGSEWEVGIGTVGTGTLARTTVLASSNAGSAVNFSAGTKDVFVTYAAGRAVNATAPTGAGQLLISNGTGSEPASYLSSGTSGQVLTQGVVPYWGAVPAAGSNTQIQYNNSGGLGASSSFTFNAAASTLVLGESAGTYPAGAIGITGYGGSGVLGMPFYYTDKSPSLNTGGACIAFDAAGNGIYHGIYRAGAYTAHLYNGTTYYVSTIVNGTERFRIGTAAQIGLNGANYGTSGQVVTSAGSGAAATWSSVVNSLTAGANITLSGSTGNITISASGGGGGGSAFTLLGTITATSGNSASLTGLTLTSYKQLYFSIISAGASAPSSYLYISGTNTQVTYACASSFPVGGGAFGARYAGSVDLYSGYSVAFANVPNIAGGFTFNPSTWAANYMTFNYTDLTTASTAVYFRWSGTATYSGTTTILVYGVA